MSVQINVTFDSSGKVTKTEIYRGSGCSAFDKEAMRTGKRIKFDPEIKDGQPVTVIKVIEYGYFEY